MRRVLRVLGSATVGTGVVALIVLVLLNFMTGCGTGLPGASCVLLPY